MNRLALREPRSLENGLLQGDSNSILDFPKAGFSVNFEGQIGYATALDFDHFPFYLRAETLW